MTNIFWLLQAYLFTIEKLTQTTGITGWTGATIIQKRIGFGHVKGVGGQKTGGAGQANGETGQKSVETGLKESNMRKTSAFLGLMLVIAGQKQHRVQRLVRNISGQTGVVLGQGKGNVI